MTRVVATAQGALFDLDDALPDGLSFEPGFIGADEERALLDIAASLPLHEARYHEYLARRRVYAFGGRADDSPDDVAARPGLEGLPEPLRALRRRLAQCVGIAASDFAHVMIAEYRPGTPLGWHRDAPHYELIAGVSLGGPAELRFRPYPPRAPKKEDIVTLALAPRSAYVVRGTARWGWQHSVPPVPALRYSITMRTWRAPKEVNRRAASGTPAPRARAARGT